jgi:transposase
VRQWLSEHPRFHIHYTPTSGSWLNAVERVFSDVKQKCLRRRSVDSVEALEKAIGEHLDLRNRAPKPFHWKAPVVEILHKVKRALGGVARHLWSQETLRRPGQYRSLSRRSRRRPELTGQREERRSIISSRKACPQPTPIGGLSAPVARNGVRDQQIARHHSTKERVFRFRRFGSTARSNQLN